MLATRPKKKILKGEYFEIRRLLPTLSDSDDEGKKGSKECNIYGFGEWVRCFHTLMAIRLEYAPRELQGMLRHCEIVQNLYTQGRDGIQYDAQFRRGKEQHPIISWGKYLPDIVLSIPARGIVGPRPSWPKTSGTYSPRVMNAHSF